MGQGPAKRSKRRDARRSARPAPLVARWASPAVGSAVAPPPASSAPIGPGGGGGAAKGKKIPPVDPGGVKGRKAGGKKGGANAPPPPPTKLSKGQRRRAAIAARKANAGVLTPVPGAPCTEASAPGSHNAPRSTWAQVVGRKASQAAKAAATKSGRGKGGKGRGATTPAPPKSGAPGGAPGLIPRIPRTAAVTITAPVGGEREFSARVTGAMAAIKVADLGIAAMRPKRAVTGALILEIPGSQSSAKAAALKLRLAEQLEGTGIKVQCPLKTAEFRVCGLTELASEDAIRGAIAAQGGCPATSR